MHVYKLTLIALGGSHFSTNTKRGHAPQDCVCPNMGTCESDNGFNMWYTAFLTFNTEKQRLCKKEVKLSKAGIDEQEKQARHHKVIK